jgi:hypothetical protein
METINEFQARMQALQRASGMSTDELDKGLRLLRTRESAAELLARLNRYADRRRTGKLLAK